MVNIFCDRRSNTNAYRKKKNIENLMIEVCDRDEASASVNGTAQWWKWAGNIHSVYISVNDVIQIHWNVFAITYNRIEYYCLCTYCSGLCVRVHTHHTDLHVWLEKYAVIWVCVWRNMANDMNVCVFGPMCVCVCFWALVHVYWFHLVFICVVSAETEIGKRTYKLK